MAEDEQNRTTVGKSAMIEALTRTLGIVTQALKLAGVARSTYYKWLNEDPEFKSATEEVDEIARDFGESQLHSLMSGIKVKVKTKDGKGELVYKRPPDTSAVIFFNKCKNKKRGYVERQEITPVDSEGNNLQPIININVIQPKKNLEDSE